MKITHLKVAAIVAVIVVLNACSGVDIDDDIAVMKDVQGTWVGNIQAGNIYRHIKVNITDNRFDGWLQTSDSLTEPAWAVLPTETGTFSISSAREKLSGTGKFRSFNFVILGRCCGDNSLTAKTLSEMITYDSRKGLLMAGRLTMTRVR
jgi:hypothetical protein